MFGYTFNTLKTGHFMIILIIMMYYMWKLSNSAEGMKRSGSIMNSMKNSAMRGAITGGLFGGSIESMAVGSIIFGAIEGIMSCRSNV